MNLRTPIVCHRLLAVLFMGTLTVGAQSPARSWDNVRALAPGTGVLLGPKRPGDVRAKVETVTEESVIVTSQKGQETFQRRELIWVSVRQSNRKRHVISGLKWGAVLGAGLGVLAGLGLCYEAKDRSASCYASFIAGGAANIGGIGALIGAIRPAAGWREIYHE